LRVGGDAVGERRWRKWLQVGSLGTKVPATILRE
jgi:hypothetical protein